jgi:hypothetical protein
MILVLGVAACVRDEDAVAWLDRRQARRIAPGSGTPAARAIDAGSRLAGIMPDRVVGPERLIAVLGENRPVTVLETGEDAAIAVILGPGTTGLAVLGVYGGEPVGVADIGARGLGDLAGVNVPRALSAARALAEPEQPPLLPWLSGIAALSLAIFDRRLPAARGWAARPDFPPLAAVGLDLPQFSRFWPSPAEGRAAVALLPDGTRLRVGEPPRRRPEWRDPTDLSPTATEFAARDFPALTARLASGEAGGAGTCRAIVLADDPPARVRAAAALSERATGASSAPISPRDIVEPVSGSVLVRAPLGADAPVAFLYPGFGAGYVGMIGRLLEALPALADHLESSLGDRLDELMPASVLFPPRGAGARFGAKLRGDARSIAGAEFVSHLVLTWVARHHLGLRPTAAIGVSLGALGMVPALCADATASARVLTGEPSLVEATARLIEAPSPTVAGETAAETVPWVACWLAGPADVLAAGLARDPALDPLVVAEPRLVLAGGSRAALRAFAKRHGIVATVAGHSLSGLHTARIREPIARLMPAMRAPMLGLPREGLAGIDMYVSDRPLRAGASAAALAEFYQRMLESLAVTADFPAIIRAAYRRGIRVFVSCGGRDNMVVWVRRILGDLPHLAVPLAPSHLEPWWAIRSAEAMLRLHGIIPPARRQVA